MTTDAGPYDIGLVPLVLGPSGAATPVPLGPEFYESLDRDFAGFAGHVLVSRCRFAEAWPSWKMHPKGDEFVYLLSGDVDFVLWRDGAAAIVRVDRPGCHVVVPRGTWHTARPHTPTTLLFVTPGEGTQHAAAPPAV